MCFAVFRNKKSGKGSCTTASSVSINVYQNCNVVCPGIEMAVTGAFYNLLFWNG